MTLVQSQKSFRKKYLELHPQYRRMFNAGRLTTIVKLVHPEWETLQVRRLVARIIEAWWSDIRRGRPPGTSSTKSRTKFKYFYLATNPQEKRRLCPKYVFRSIRRDHPDWKESRCQHATNSTIKKRWRGIPISTVTTADTTKTSPAYWNSLLKQDGLGVIAR